MAKPDAKEKGADEPRYIPNDQRKIAHSILVDAAGQIGDRCIQMTLKEDPRELIRLTEHSTHDRHHQKYPLDERVEGIANEVLRPKIEQLERLFRTRMGKRIEHSAEPVVNAGSRIYLLSNPTEGSDNFADHVRHSAVERLQERSEAPSFNPQACITLAIVEADDPFNPIATAVYHFLNHKIYSSECVIGPNYEKTPRAYIGRQAASIGRAPEELPRVTKDRDLKFFVADYKFRFIGGIDIIREALLSYAEKKGFPLDTQSGQCATASNVLQVIDGGAYDGYIDPRAIFRIPSEHARKGRYAKLLYTNVIAVLPIAQGYGFTITDYDGQPLSMSEGFKLDDKESHAGNMEIPIVIARSHMFEQQSDFNVIMGLKEGKDAALAAWEKYNAGDKA